jgi:hypothetical protein
MNGRLRILSKLKVDEKRKCWRFIFIRTNILSAVSFFFYNSVGFCAARLPVAKKVSWLISFSVDSRVHLLARIYYLLVISIVFVRFVVPFLLLLFKWWLVYQQHDRSVCMAGNPREVRSWLCGVESSPTKMSCVYACVKNIRKVSRNVWMHFERGMVTVYIRQKFTLHSSKKNDLNSRSLTLTIPPSRSILVEDEKESFCCCAKDTIVRCGRIFGRERFIFRASTFR